MANGGEPMSSTIVRTDANAEAEVRPKLADRLSRRT